MTAPADRTHEILLRVADFLRKLPADQIEALASGEAKLELVGITRRTKEPVVLPVDATQVNSELKALNDRADAARYLRDLRLNKQQMQELARKLDVPCGSKDTMASIMGNIVEQKVGRRLVSDAIFNRR